MTIKEKIGEESETWVENEIKNHNCTFLNYKQREKVLNRYRELKFCEDYVYIKRDFSGYIVENKKFNVQKKSSLLKLFIRR